MSSHNPFPVKTRRTWLKRNPHVLSKLKDKQKYATEYEKKLKEIVAKAINDMNITQKEINKIREKGRGTRTNAEWDQILIELNAMEEELKIRAAYKYLAEEKKQKEKEAFRYLAEEKKKKDEEEKVITDKFIQKGEHKTNHGGVKNKRKTYKRGKKKET
jgi:hypothetical protein